MCACVRARERARARVCLPRRAAHVVQADERLGKRADQHLRRKGLKGECVCARVRVCVYDYACACACACGMLVCACAKVSHLGVCENVGILH